MREIRNAVCNPIQNRTDEGNVETEKESTKRTAISISLYANGYTLIKKKIAMWIIYWNIAQHNQEYISFSSLRDMILKQGSII